MNNFNEDLAFSEMARTASFWGDIYRRAFPDMVHSYLNDRDNGAQRCGVDRLIVLKSTRILRIDEKVRRKDYGDILLEYVSNDRTQAHGWIEKDLTIDYIAYGILPLRRCYLFPWDMLRRVWVAFGSEWIADGAAKKNGLRIASAVNREGRADEYRTLSVCVPLELLRRKIGAASVIQLPDAEPDVRQGTLDL